MLASSLAARSVYPTTSRCELISFVILSVSARWMAGSLANGAMFAT